MYQHELLGQESKCRIFKINQFCFGLSIKLFFQGGTNLILQSFEEVDRVNFPIYEKGRIFYANKIMFMFMFFELSMIVNAEILPPGLKIGQRVIPKKALDNSATEKSQASLFHTIVKTTMIVNL